jgi:type II secretory pathway pseudopilin PulG
MTLLTRKKVKYFFIGLSVGIVAAAVIVNVVRDIQERVADKLAEMRERGYAGAMEDVFGEVSDYMGTGMAAVQEAAKKAATVFDETHDTRRRFRRAIDERTSGRVEDETGK